MAICRPEAAMSMAICKHLLPAPEVAKKIEPLLRKNHTITFRASSSAIFI